MKYFVFILFYYIVALPTQASNKYWIYFKDKGDTSKICAPLLSPDGIANRITFQLSTRQWTDFPVNNQFIHQIEQLGTSIIVKSKWLNAVSAILNETQLQQVKSLAFVSKVQHIKSNLKPASDTPPKAVKKYASSIDMMQAESFVAAGLDGSNVKLGVIDAGFDNADKDSNLVHLFKKKNIRFTKDFLQPSHDTAFYQAVTKSDFHGTEVLLNLAGNSKGNKPIQFGLATNAQYYLARTEDGDHESRKEEDLWIAAMEWMDSLGVRLISTSLGYARDMDNPDENYKIAEMNGKTSAISKAASIAVNEKGIFLVVAAGNEGHKSDWKIITTPADVEGVVSVGAAYANWQKAGYSSVGYDSVPFIKPNLSTFSLTGTSFSAPAVAGFVACMMQKNPLLKSDSIKTLLYQSAHLYPYGNNYIGFGMPLADVAWSLLSGIPNRKTYKPIKITGESVTINIEQPDIHPILAFHKKDYRTVINQEELKTTNQKTFWEKIFFIKNKKHIVTLVRQKGIAFTTLQIGLTVFEFEW